ncbi:MAG: hypothetical protein JW923_08525 [Spirochaetales bacterium]|nr:hypothetical protein [Spirochaetales bacterium]
MGIMASIVEFFRKLFGVEDSSAKGELKRLYAPIARLKPPYYRFKNNLVMQGFAQDLYLFCRALKPLMDLSDRTLSHPDIRVSRRFFDFLVESELPPAELERKLFFVYDGMKSRVENAVKGDEELDHLGRDFQRFLGMVDELGAGPLNKELAEVSRFIEICRHDWERMLGFFDPGVSLDDARYRADFQPADGELIFPELVDAYYLTQDFWFSDALLGKVMRVFEKHAPNAARGQRPKMEKIFSTLNKILRYRLSEDNLLAVIRLCKRDPLFQPDLRRERVNYVENYRRRLTTQFEKDRERLQRERHENAVAKDIQELFGTVDVAAVDEYNEDNDSFLRQECPSGFTHIKALSIMKTFAVGIFEQQIKETVKKVLVEGYFENKTYQNNLANILYQCDRTSGRITAFEESLRSGGRVSIASVKRYVDEMRHGKDIMSFLTKVVDEINYRAKEICEDEAGLFQMLGDSLGELLADYRKSSPELITNIRSLGGVRNREIINQLTDGRRRIDTFVRIMKNFTYVKKVAETAQEPVPAEVPVAGYPSTDFEEDLPSA